MAFYQSMSQSVNVIFTRSNSPVKGKKGYLHRPDPPVYHNRCPRRMFPQESGADVHLRHLRLINLLAVYVQFAGTTERLGQLVYQQHHKQLCSVQGNAGIVSTSAGLPINRNNTANGGHGLPEINRS